MATLIIGLGGTGGEVVSRVKRELADSPVTDVAYLQIDTKPAPVGGLHPDTEYVPIGGFNVRTAHDEHRRHINEWWYPTNTAEDFDMDGTGQTRLYGRLAMYLFGSDVLAHIIAQMRSLNSPAIRVIVACSVTGGTGSSLIGDVGYLIRAAARETAIRVSASLAVCLDHSIAARFMSSDRAGAAQATCAGLATLTELDFFMRHGAEGSSGAAGRYEFAVHGSPAHRNVYEAISGSPYSGVFVLQRANANGIQMERIEHYYDLAAMGVRRLAGLFSSIAPEPRGFPAENHFDVMQQNAGRTRDGRCRAYGSFSGVELAFPRDRVVRHLQSRLRENLGSQLVQPQTAEDESVTRELAARLLGQAGIKESDNADMLRREVRLLMKELDKAAFPLDSDQGKKTLAKDLVAAGTQGSVLVAARIAAGDRALAELSNKAKSPIVGRYLELRQAFVDALDKECDRLLQDGKWVLAKALCDELKKLLQREHVDVTANEVPFRDATTWSEIQTSLHRAEGEILREASARLLRRVFKKSEVRAAIARPARTLAGEWFDRAVPYLCCTLFADHALDLYESLIAEVESRRDEFNEGIQLLVDDVSQAQRGIGDPLKTRVDTVLNAGDLRALQVEVAAFGAIIDDVLLPRAQKDPSLAELPAKAGRAASREKDAAAAVRTLQEMATAAAQQVVKDLDLTEALRLEAQWFIEHFEGGRVRAAISGGDVRKLPDLVRHFDKIFDGPALDDALRPAIVAQKLQRNTRDGIVIARLREVMRAAAPYWNVVGEADEEKPNRFGVQAWRQTGGRNGDFGTLLAAAAEAGVPTTGTLDDQDRAFVTIFEIGQSLGNLSALIADRPDDLARRAFTEDPRKAGASDRRFLDSPPYSDHRIYRADDAAPLAFALAEAMGLVTTASQRRANFQWQVRLKKSGVKKGDPFGASLEQCVARLQFDRELVGELMAELVAHIGTELAKSKKAVAARVEAQMERYAELGRKCAAGSESRRLYDELHLVLEDYARNLR